MMGKRRRGIMPSHSRFGWLAGANDTHGISQSSLAFAQRSDTRVEGMVIHPTSSPPNIQF